MRERPEHRWWRAGGLAIAAFGLLLGGWLVSTGLDRSLSNIELFGDSDSDSGDGVGALFLLVGLLVFFGAPKLGAVVGRSAPVRHQRRWIELAAFVPLLLPDWGERAASAELFLIVAGVASIAVRPLTWPTRLGGFAAGSVIAAAFGEALHPGLWLAAGALVVSELLAREPRRRPVSPDYDVEFVWKEAVVYREGERAHWFPAGWGVRPIVTYVPPASEWDEVVPEWLRGRRREVLDRLAAVDGHVLRPAPPGLSPGGGTSRPSQ